MVVVLLAAVVWMWSLLAASTCPGIVACETITLRAPVRGRITAVHAAVGDRVRNGDRVAQVEPPDQAAELARLRERRAVEARLLARLEAEAVVAETVTAREPSVPAVPVPPARTAELAALTSELKAAQDEAAAREETRERMALLVRLDAAVPEDVEAAAREARLARARVDTLAARRAGLTAAPPAGTPVPVEAAPAPRPSPQDQRPAVRERLAALDAAIVQAAPRTILATCDGTVLERSALGSEVVVDGMVAVVADTGHLWIDAYLPKAAGDRAGRARIARIRGLAQELPLRSGAWHEQAVPAALRPWLSTTTALSQRLDLPAPLPLIPGQVVDITVR